MPKRALPVLVCEPERTTDAIILRCRNEVEGYVKAQARQLLLPWLRWKLGAAELGEGFQWGRRLILGKGSRIGRYAYLGPDFSSHGPVVVGDLCMIAAGCRVVGDDHVTGQLQNPTRLGWPDAPRRVTAFGVDAWIGERVTIREGITIGAGAVVGSGATVVHDVAAYTIVAGTPARVVKDRFSSDHKKLHDATVRRSSHGAGSAHGLGLTL